MTDNKNNTQTKKSTPSTKPEEKQDKQTSSIAENTSFDLVLPWSVVSSAYEHEIGHMAGHLKMSGFRPGKVPASVAEKHIDQEQLVTRVLRAVVPAILEARFKAEGDTYKPVSQPSVQPVSTLKGVDWKVTVSFAEAPVIKLGDYKKTVAGAKKASEKEIADQEKALQEQSKKAAEEKKTAKKADDKNKDKSAEPTKSAPTTLSEEQKKEIQLRFIFRDLVESVKPAIPELLVREETEYRLHNLAHSLQQFKMELNDYLKRRGGTIEDIIGEFQAEALASLQLEFILSEVGKTAKVEVTDADREEAIKGIEDKKLQDQYKKDKEYQTRLDNTLYRRKIIEHLLSL